MFRSVALLPLSVPWVTTLSQALLQVGDAIARAYLGDSLSQHVLHARLWLTARAGPVTVRPGILVARTGLPSDSPRGFREYGQATAAPTSAPSSPVLSMPTSPLATPRGPPPIA